MGIETDYLDVNINSDVCYRTCKHCGKTFEIDPNHKSRTVCKECRDNRNHHSVGEKKRTSSVFREMKRSDEIEAKKRAERIRKRDAAFARWERENGVAPRFEYHGDTLVEIRGRVG